MACFAILIYISMFLTIFFLKCIDLFWHHVNTKLNLTDNKWKKAEHTWRVRQDLGIVLLLLLLFSC